MTIESGVIYEVSLDIEPDIVGEFDAWLAGHIDDMLTIPGFISARTFVLEDSGDGKARRVTHFHLESEADLEQYLSGPAAAMRQAATDRFGDRFTASRRVLHAMPSGGIASAPVEQCLNCKTPLSGQYCANCGQRARSRLISLWELVRDAFGDLFELDSRLWRTMIPLFARPGLLTRDYLEGRRVRFMPPFRTYLVLSIIFFLIAFSNPKKDLQILFEPEETESTTVTDSATDTGGDEAPSGQEVLEQLEEAGVELSEEDKEELKQATEGLSINLSDGTAESACELDDFENTQMPPWLAKRLTKERLLRVCEKVTANNGRDFLNQLLDKVPAALFFLLPLMALVLKILYPLSKRYYVEHLLFVVHFHAFFFLVLTLQILLARTGPLVAIPAGAVNTAIVAISFYIPVYLYKAMRRVYGQGHLLTLPKYLMLVVAYAIGFSLVLLVATLIAAFSI
ncbi:MAG: DUF4286 family protein [Woeseiaceae bacterium]|nr:DUF4286 family protein [Woeseiaceae bacterium]